MSIVNDICSKDLTRYEFNNNEYINYMLVAAVISDYVAKHGELDYDELSEVFPSQLQGEQGVFAAHEEIEEITEGKKTDAFLTGPCDSIQLKDCLIHISTSWTMENISRFIEHVLTLGYDISKVQSSYSYE